jgi:BON domain
MEGSLYEPKVRKVFTGIMISLLAMGCIHEPTYYTIYTPEKRSTNGYGSVSGLSTNGQMNTTNHVSSGNTNVGVSPANVNSNTGASFNSTNQPSPSTDATNYSGHLYTEAPRTAPSPVSSNPASRIYSEPSNQGQTLARDSKTGSVPAGQDTLWLPQDQGVTASDRAIIRQVRQAWNQDYNLSLAATGLKIVADNGRVIISGAVATEQEKERLEALARRIPGLVSVQDQLTVKPGS